jgi:hypothetical protein
MRFHWLRDSIRHGQFTLLYLAGKQNLADFFNKTLPVAIHHLMMPWLVSSPSHTRALHMCRVTRRLRRLA